MDLLSKKEINGEELKELLRLRKNNKLQFLLVDVREEYEYIEITIAVKIILKLPT